jgi:hypothetical protein
MRAMIALSIPVLALFLLLPGATPVLPLLISASM